jgi:hypothetical protein
MSIQVSPPKDVMVTKGTRVLVRHMKNPKLVPLAGMQMKMQVSMDEFTGTVRHVRGDDPVVPKTIHFWVEPDANPDNRGEMCAKCGVREIEVPKEAIAAVIEDE